MGALLVCKTIFVGKVVFAGAVGAGVNATAAI